MILRAIGLYVGLIFIALCSGTGVATVLTGYHRKQIWIWAPLLGTVLLFAFFQIISIPFIILERPFSEVVLVYGICIGIWVSLNLLFLAFSLRKKMIIEGKQRENKNNQAPFQKVIWILFFLLLFFQLFQVIFLSYADGDDAFYIGVAAVTEESNTMYRILPYTGTTTELDIRHGLAPFPIWIAFLSKISGCPVVTVSHVVLPLFLIPLTYLLYGIIGSVFLREKKWIPIFLIFIELLILWGNVSFFTSETFLLTRSRQGKAAIANLILPFLVLLLYMMSEKIQNQKKISRTYWVILSLSVVSACFCTTLGSFLSCLIIGVSGICMAVIYKKFKIMISLACCCLPAFIYFGLYVLL